MKKYLPLVLVISVFAILLTAGSTLAAAAPGYANVSNVPTLVNTWLNVALGIASIVATIFIIIGGFGYITSSGNAEKVQIAQKTITYAIIGLIIIALAFAIKGFAINKLLGTTDANVQDLAQ